MDVQRSDLVREPVRQQSPEEGPRVDDGEDVGGQRSAHAADLRGVEFDVEEGDVDAHEAEEDAEAEEEVGGVAEGGGVVDLSERG